MPGRCEEATANEIRELAVADLDRAAARRARTRVPRARMPPGVADARSDANRTAPPRNPTRGPQAGTRRHVRIAAAAGTGRAAQHEQLPGPLTPEGRRMSVHC